MINNPNIALHIKLISTKTRFYFYIRKSWWAQWKNRFFIRMCKNSNDTCRTLVHISLGHVSETATKPSKRLLELISKILELAHMKKSHNHILPIEDNVYLN